MPEVEITGDFDYERTIRGLAEIEGKSVEVGVLGTSGSDIQMIATVHEFGARIAVTPKIRGFFAAAGFPLKSTTTHIVIPERAPLRRTIDSPQTQRQIVEELEDGIDAWLAGQISVLEVLEGVGLVLAASVRTAIADGLAPENHPLTVIRKGSAKPLVDKGRLINAYTHRVV